MQKLCHDQGNNSSPDTFDLLIPRSTGKVHLNQTDLIVLCGWMFCLFVEGEMGDIV